MRTHEARPSRSNRKILLAAFALLSLSACHKGSTEPSEPSEAPAGGEAPADVPASCAAILCETNTYCDEIDGQAKCIPLPSCDTQECPEGQHCELDQVQCIRAPCPPQPVCKPDAA